MIPRVLWPLLIALGSMAGSIGLGVWNRSGPPSDGVELHAGSQVHVRGGYQPGEVRSVYLLQNVRQGWLDSAKLAALGLERRRYGTPLPRTAFLVLERDSLLTVIDAGREPGSLESRYPDREKYLVLRGVIGLHATLKGVEGYVRGLLPGELYLPPNSTPHGPFKLHSGRLRLPYVTQ